MKALEIRRALCGPNRAFTLPTSEVKDRLGHPDSIKILRNWCRDTGRDVIVFTYRTDDGEADVIGTIGFLNGEETMLDGYVIPRGSAAPLAENRGFVGPRGVLDREPTLFDAWEDAPDPAPEGMTDA